MGMLVVTKVAPVFPSQKRFNVQKFICLLLAGLLASALLQGQDCNCDHVLNDLSATDINIIHANTIDYQPGDVFCVPAGQIAGLRLLGFQGTAAAPLTFINCGGQVVINEDPHAGIMAKTDPRCEEPARSEEHTSELQSRQDISYAVFCLKKT